MADFDRTLELINISQESAGATNAQQVEFMQGLEAATIGLQTAYQQFIKTITDSDIIIGIIRIITVSIESLTGAMKLFGIEGSVAMLILGGFAIILRITSMMKGLTTAVVGATKAQTIFNAVAAINPYVLIATAIAAVVVGIGYLATSTERSAKALKKQNDEVAAASYEFNKLNKDIKSAMDTIAELNKLPFLTEKQQKEIDDALEKIAELVGEENVVRIDGVVNLQLSQDSIKKFTDDQEAALNKSTTEAFKKASKNVITQGQVIRFKQTKDPETVKSISNYIIMQYRESFDKDTKLSGTVEKLYRNFIKETLATDPESLFTDGAVENFVSSQMKENVKFLEESIKSIESNNKEFTKYYDSYLINLAKGTALEKKILNSQYKEFEILTNTYGSSARDLILQLEKIGITDFTQIATAVRDFGKELPEVLEGVNNRIQEIMGSDRSITEQTATSMAFAELSRTIGNAELSL
jgi:predicted membrane protein